MPLLPSGRRVEFSLDRFYALLGRMRLEQAFIVADALQDPDDLFVVLDAVHFSLEGGKPYFAGYVAADWESRAADWCQADRDALRAWFASDSAHFFRAEAIDCIKTLLLEMTPDGIHHAGTAYSPLSASRQIPAGAASHWEKLAGLRQELPSRSPPAPYQTE